MSIEDNSVSLDLMLVVFLSLSLMLNLYFFYQNGVLQDEIEELKTVNPGSDSNVLDEKPQACKDIPSPTAIEMVTISDKRCEDCDESVDLIKGQLKGMFPGLVVK